MIKNIIRNQIKKTGTYRVLENKNKKLKKQLQTLKKEKIKISEDNIRIINEKDGEMKNLLKETENKINILQSEKIRISEDNIRIINEKESQIKNLEEEKIRISDEYNMIINKKEELINNLEQEKQKYKVERSQKVGFGLKTGLRGVSSEEGKVNILKYFLENIKKDAKILDVGFGSGVYGKLLRTFYYQNIDGIDVYGDNIKEMGLDLIYDNIFIENILDFNFDFYDLIIMGDVLEHIELESSKNLLSRFIDENKCDTIIVSIPYEYEQDEVYGNKYEKHLQSNVTYQYMKENFPYLKLIDSKIMTHNGGVIATYIWNRTV